MEKNCDALDCPVHNRVNGGFPAEGTYVTYVGDYAVFTDLDPSQSPEYSSELLLLVLELKASIKVNYVTQAFNTGGKALLDVPAEKLVVSRFVENRYEVEVTADGPTEVGVEFIAQEHQKVVTQVTEMSALGK